MRVTATAIRSFKLAIQVLAANRAAMMAIPVGGSCAPTLLIIPSAQKPGKMPHLTTRWRGQCHGLTSVFLPTRSVGHHLALRPIASHWVQARPDYPTRGSEAQAQAFH